TGFADREVRFDKLALGFAVARGLDDCRLTSDFFDAWILSAFRARALPAGERLVAGFRRVDLTTFFLAAAFDVWRAVVRDESLFAIGLLIIERAYSFTGENAAASRRSLT